MPGRALGLSAGMISKRSWARRPAGRVTETPLIGAADRNLRHFRIACYDSINHHATTNLLSFTVHKAANGPPSDGAATLARSPA
jgi:hypothetical protein